MFRALLVHPQEALHKRHLVYCVCVMSVDCYQDWSGTTDIIHTKYTKCRLCRPPEDEQVMLEICRGP
jgi:hypothetical protein